MGTRRRAREIPGTVRVLGEGIFTTDGASWQHSRDLLRPNFVRSQIGDLPMFETHVKKLTAAIPRDGSTVDLQGLFYRLSLDIATEFLFGESSNSLAPDASKATQNLSNLSITVKIPWKIPAFSVCGGCSFLIGVLRGNVDAFMVCIRCLRGFSL